MKPQLRIVPEPPPYRRESASEIAARIRNAIPPRPVFVSEAQGNGETISWIGVAK